MFHSYRVNDSAILVRFWERIVTKMRGFRGLGWCLLRRVGDSRLDPGRVDVLEAVVLEDGRKLWRKSVEAEISGLLPHHHKRALLHHHWLLHHEVGLRLLEVMFREQNLIRLKINFEVEVESMF